MDLLIIITILKKQTETSRRNKPDIQFEVHFFFIKTIKNINMTEIWLTRSSPLKTNKTKQKQNKTGKFL